MQVRWIVPGLLALLMSVGAQALTPQQARSIATGDSDERIAAMQAALAAADTGLRRWRRPCWTTR